MRLQEQAERLSAQQFLGVPAKDFERGGREQLSYLLAAGLNPASKLLDLGCGVLRAGYWLIHFLDPGCYHGIEPHVGRLEIGMHTMLEPEVLQSKRPRFDTNPRFDTGVFAEKFDYFLAYSIWTHASKRQIRVMLDGFLRDSQNDAVFLTTFYPAGWRHRDYRGDTWHGTSHECDVPGCIYHSYRWVRAECHGRDLVVRRIGRDLTTGQVWLDISRRARHT